MKKLLLAFASVAMTLLSSASNLASVARADEIAPELELQELREIAASETKQLVAGLDADVRKRLVGIYVAYEANAADPSAMASCDDDGDYVIVVNDAFLRLASHVARAQSYDEESGQHTIEDYASFVARSQVRGRRLLPPPPGSLTSDASGESRAARLHEAIAFVIARELAHLRAGDLVCAHPTATREHGDEEWTDGEQAWAMIAAARLYPGRAAERDAEAATRTIATGQTTEGALGLLRFFAKIDAERAAAPDQARFVPRYLTLHPNAASRIATVKKASADVAKAQEAKDEKDAAITKESSRDPVDDSPVARERAAMARGERPKMPSRKAKP